MKKRMISLLLCVMMAIAMVSGLTAGSSAQAQTVNPTPSTVFINGSETAFEAYNIGGNNFFKLRDLAYVLNGTDKQFEVGYNNVTRAIILTSGQSYTVDGSEMRRGDGSSKAAALNSAINISKDGAPVEITAYMIDGNNFMRLRDVMRLLDVFVGYDEATRNITIDTSRGYVEEGTTAAPSGASGTIPNGRYVNNHILAGSDDFSKPHIVINDNNSFTFRVNLFEGMGEVTGSYTYTGNTVVFTPEHTIYGMDESGRQFEVSAIRFRYTQDKPASLFYDEDFYIGMSGKDDEFILALAGAPSTTTPLTPAGGGTFSTPPVTINTWWTHEDLQYVYVEITNHGTLNVILYPYGFGYDGKSEWVTAGITAFGLDPTGLPIPNMGFSVLPGETKVFKSIYTSYFFTVTRFTVGFNYYYIQNPTSLARIYWENGPLFEVPHDPSKCTSANRCGG